MVLEAGNDARQMVRRRGSYNQHDDPGLGLLKRFLQRIGRKVLAEPDHIGANSSSQARGDRIVPRGTGAFATILPYPTRPARMMFQWSSSTRLAKARRRRVEFLTRHVAGVWLMRRLRDRESDGPASS